MIVSVVEAVCDDAKANFTNYKLRVDFFFLFFTWFSSLCWLRRPAVRRGWPA